MHLHAMMCFFALLLIFFNLSLVAVSYTQLLPIINAHIFKNYYKHACSQRLELMREMYHNEAELSPTSPDYNVESLTGGNSNDDLWKKKI